MKKYKIFYIDDQSFALPQLIKSIPDDIDFEFIYVQRIIDIIEDEYDIVILDFYLDKDWKTALDVVSLFQCKVIISFSTSKQKNAMMLKKFVSYGVEKLKDTNNNIELTETMQKIFSKI